MRNEEKTWQWSDAYGDEGGDALLRESNGNGAVLIEAACSTEEIPSRVRALTELAPDMDEMLRFTLRVLKELAEAHDATDDLETNQALSQGWALIRAIDERSKGG